MATVFGFRAIVLKISHHLGPLFWNRCKKGIRKSCSAVCFDFYLTTGNILDDLELERPPICWKFREKTVILHINGEQIKICPVIVDDEQFES